MKTRRSMVAGSLLGLVFAGPAHAGSGQIDSFGASATQVVAGSTVDFWLGYSLSTSSSINGGSNPTPPDPVEGYQTWDINWYSTETETATFAYFDAGGNFYSEVLSVPPGGSHSGSLSFQLEFTTPGLYTVSASGGFDSAIEFYTSNESAWRTCWYADPDNPVDLTCDGWTYTYSDWDDQYTTSTSFESRFLTIEVTPVPEPGTVALWLAGLAGLAGVAWRRRRG